MTRPSQSAKNVEAEAVKVDGHLTGGCRVVRRGTVGG